MKTCIKIFFFPLCFVIFSILQSSAQSCYPDGLFLLSQADVDAFGEDHPDCKVIEGTLFIGGVGITNLDGLSGIEEVKLGISISSSEVLENTSGLSSLKKVGGKVLVSDNPILVSIEELTNLDSIGTSVIIVRNESLQKISGFSGAHTLRSIDINNNPELDTLIAFQNVQSITHLDILNNYKLKYANILNSMDSCISIRVANSPDLVRFEGFENLEYTDNLHLSDMQDIPEFNNLISLGVMQLHRCQAKEIRGFSKLETVLTTLGFTLCDSLEVLDGFNSLVQVGRLYIELNRNQRSLKGFQNLESVRTFEVGGLPLLEELEAFNELELVDSVLKFIISNPAITDLNFLSNIKKAKEIYIGQSSLFGESYLTDISALDDLDHEYLRELRIVGCPELEICSHYGVCRFLEREDAIHDIRDNAPGCNSAEEILENCVVSSVEEGAEVSKITISPNPVRQIFKIHTDDDLKINSWLIFSIDGIQILKGESSDMEINLTQFPEGIYLVHVTTDKGVFIEKLILSN